MSLEARLVHGACWRGTWLEGDLIRPSEVDNPPPTSHPRLARANRLTRLGAACVERAIETLPPMQGDRKAIIGATTFASLRTNLRYEKRRLQTGRAAPKDFALTAPNAWIGEIAVATNTLGPSTCLVGPDAGIQAIATALRWLISKACDRVVVVAAESLPDDPSFVGKHEPMEGAAALVLQAEAPHALASVMVSWDSEVEPTLSSLDTVSQVWLEGRGGRHLEIGSKNAGLQLFLHPITANSG